MGHSDSLISIAIVGLAALLCGMVMTRLRQPALVGYILAGVLLGPSLGGLVMDRERISLFSEIGVLMLLFLIGMELPLNSFLRVWRPALACTVLQILGGLGFAWLLSFIITAWTDERVIIAGFIMALSSTAVAIKILEEIGEMDSETGRLTLAVLIAQDLAVVPMMLIVRDFGQDGLSIAGFVQIALAVGFLVGCLIYIDRKGSLNLPIMERIAGNADLRAIGALGLCLGAAALSGLAGLSPAYGAFLAGIFIGNTNHSKEMIESTQPIQSLFIMVFFLSIGLLIDLGFIWQNLGEVLVWLLVVTLFKTALNIGVLRLLGNPWDRSFLSGVVMGQIGEFSFVLVATAMAAGLMPEDRYRLAVAIIALSLMVSPLWLAVARRLVPIMALSITSFREIVRLLLGDRTLELAAKSRLAAQSAALAAAKAAAGKLKTMRGNGGANLGAQGSRVTGRGALSAAAERLRAMRGGMRDAGGRAARASGLSTAAAQPRPVGAAVSSPQSAASPTGLSTGLATEPSTGNSPPASDPTLPPADKPGKTDGTP